MAAVEDNDGMRLVCRHLSQQQRQFLVGEIPTVRSPVALKLMIRGGLYRSAELVPVGVESLSPGAAGNLVARPRVDFKFNEHKSFCVEEEHDFV